MSHETERVAVTNHFKSVWLDSDGPIAWQNQPFTTPTNSMFCAVSIVSRGAIRRNIGSTFIKRHFRTLQVDIYTPMDKGTKRSREIGDRLELIYEMLILPLPDGESLQFANTTSRVLDPNVIRASNLDDNWDRFMFEAPFHRDQLVEK